MERTVTAEIQPIIKHQILLYLTTRRNESGLVATVVLCVPTIVVR
jgi:hypothetical protein